MTNWWKVYCISCGHGQHFHPDGVCQWQDCQCKRLVIPLTDQECKVFLSLARGFTVKEIAQQLSLATKTIETHKSNLMQKLDAHRQYDITFIALQSGVLTLEDVPQFEIGKNVVRASPLAKMN